MKTQTLIILALILNCVALNASDTLNVDNVTCRTCHICDEPSLRDPCLVKCPRLPAPTGKHISDFSPDIISMDGLSDLYAPVVFSHKQHAAMSEMSGGCSLCHHHSTDSDINPCISCHPESPIRADISRPSLKGAYHRQCLGCHREWSHDTKCTECHALKSESQLLEADADSTDFIGMAHPRISEPKRLVYTTDHEQGKLVTFYHDDHVHLFGLQCVDCHQSESCQRCHDQLKTGKLQKTNYSAATAASGMVEDPHQNCNRCHSGTKCTACHDAEMKQPFNHLRRTKWDLNTYHAKVTCRQCHQLPNRFSGLHKECAGCHADWNAENFTHQITGIQLDETHSEFDCEVCHLDNLFQPDPGCDECHDTDIGYPAQLPGKRLKQGK